MSDGASLLPGPFQNVAFAVFRSMRMWSARDSYIVLMRARSTLSGMPLSQKLSDIPTLLKSPATMKLARP